LNSEIEVADDYLARYEFTEARRPMHSWAPHLKLMFEVLADAIRVYQGEVRVPALQRAEVEAWMFDRWRDADDSVFTFGSICLALGIDREKLRAGLIASKGNLGRRICRRSPARNMNEVSAIQVRSRQGVGSRRA
jgi:hypothetical protein